MTMEITTENETDLQPIELAGTLENAPDLLTITEAADLLRVPRSWLYANTKSGRFPCVRMGKYVRIRRSDIHDWIESGGVGHVSE